MKFLVAVDGSKDSLRAAKHSANLLEKMGDGSSAVLVYVYEFKELRGSSGVEPPVGVPSQKESTKQMVRRKYGKIPANFNEFSDAEIRNTLTAAEKAYIDKGINYETKVLEGSDVARVICDYAKNYGFDQIVIGSRGLGGIRGVILGSVSHKIIQIAPCPVLMVK